MIGVAKHCWEDRHHHIQKLKGLLRMPTVIIGKLKGLCCTVQHTMYGWDSFLSNNPWPKHTYKGSSFQRNTLVGPRRDLEEQALSRNDMNNRKAIQIPEENCNLQLCHLP